MQNKPFHLDKVAIRMVKEPPLYSEVPINNPQDAIKLMADTLSDYDREVFAIINFRPDLKPINVNFVSMGALDQSLVHPREAIKSMVLSNVASVMLVHNHTTGAVHPSREDVAVTDRMSKLCNMLGIKLLDHVIVGPGNDYYSFNERGVLPVPSLKLETNIDQLEFGGMKVAETATMEKQNVREVSFVVAECSEFHNLGEFHENVGSVKDALVLFEQIPPERMHALPTIGIRVTDTNHPEIFTEIDIIRGNTIDMDMLSYVPEIASNKTAQFAIAEMIHAMPKAEIIGTVPEEIQKKVSVIEAKEKQAEQMKAITDKLEQGVAEVFSSDKYKQFLDTMAKFPRYSVNNNILIMMQKPDAQMCQSFTGWKEMGRFVKKGEKGIKILAPAPYTIQREQNKLDDRGNPMMDKDGEPIMESVEIKVNAFKVVSTFDVSQTDGKELPSLGVDELTGGVDGYGTFLEALKEVCPVPITFENIEGGAKGFYSQTEKRIAIQEGMSEAQTVKTTIHEMAHQKLHAIENNGPKQLRNSKEVEAESVAYTVCQHYGIDTSDYSFSYVAGWSEGKEMPELKASLDTIRKAASEMITAIDEKMEILIQEKQKDVFFASDVTNLKGMDYQYSEGSCEAEYRFSCEVKGEPTVLTYTLSHHDDGQGFVMHTDKNDIWETMSEPELRKLEEKVSQVAESYHWERRIDAIKEPTEVEVVKAGLLEQGTTRIGEENRMKLREALEAKEKAILAPKPEKEKERPKEKATKKTSVKTKLQEGKEKVAKTPAKKTKAKEERV